MTEPIPLETLSMKKVTLCLALLGLLALGGQALAVNLHVPHFEVDLSAPDAPTSLLAVTNASSTAVLARVDVFDAHGTWLGPFHLQLAAGATSTLNWRDVLENGKAICPPAAAFLTSTALQAGLDQGEQHYAGYAQVTAVSSCSVLPPGDPGFPALEVDGSHLVGDLIRVDPGHKFSHGDRLPAKLCPGRHLVRFLDQGGTFDGTHVYFYMPSAAGPDSTPVPVTALDEPGNPVFLAVGLVGGLRVNAASDFDVNAALGPNQQFGTLTFDCGSSPCYVSVEYRADGRYSASVPGVALDPCP